MSDILVHSSTVDTSLAGFRKSQRERKFAAAYNVRKMRLRGFPIKGEQVMLARCIFAHSLSRSCISLLIKHCHPNAVILNQTLSQLPRRCCERKANKYTVNANTSAPLQGTSSRLTPIRPTPSHCRLNILRLHAPRPFAASCICDSESYTVEATGLGIHQHVYCLLTIVSQLSAQKGLKTFPDLA